MDTNLFFQLCGIVNILIILFSFLFKKKMLTRNNVIFMEMIIFGLIALDVDNVQFALLADYHKYNPFLVKELCKLSMALYVCFNYLLLRYIGCDVFRIKPVRRTLINTLATILLITSIALIMTMPVKILNPGESNAYASGPAAYIMLAFIAAFLLIACLFTLCKENNASKKRKRVIRLWTYFWFIAMIIEIITNHVFKDFDKYPLFGFVSSICIILLFIVLENPDYSLDKETRTFNQSKCMEYTFDLHRKKKDYYLLLVITDGSIPQFRNYSYKLETMSEYAKDISTLRKGKVFRSDNDNFIVVTRHEENLDFIINYLIDKYNKIDALTNDLSFYHNLKFVKLVNPYVVENNISVIDILKNVGTDFSLDRGSESILELNDEVISKINRDKEMELIVNDAIRNDRVLVYLQPIYSLEEKKFVSAEALARIKDADGNIIYPGSFIEVCEKNGSIFRLGSLVFEHICRFIKKYNMDALGLHYIEVNLSAVQCEYEGIADLYMEIMEKYEVNPKYINLEITETGNANRKRMIENMNKLVKCGAAFSLDDFGTGNSNLNYIVDMPVNLVKFDKEMVTSFFEDKKAKFVMSSAITMIKDMNLKIVLEGIEDKNQILSIQRRKINIDYIQGYYYSKPIPEDDFVKFIVEKNKVKGSYLN